MLEKAFWNFLKWSNRSDSLLAAIEDGQYETQQIALLIQYIDEWVMDAQSYGCPYIEIEIGGHEGGLSEDIAIPLADFLEENNFQVFLTRTNISDKLYVILAGWYSDFSLPKFDGNIYLFRTRKALEMKLPKFAKEEENGNIYIQSIKDFDYFTYQCLK